ncbi:MAG: hypothetical protein JNL18_24105 [Planctomycetaceae bacterium]|nr:hypothetical protein [Planctomycetaceae bacterium]
MAKIIRYALATFCFAASIGCLALWWRSYTVHEQIYWQSPISSDLIYFSAFRGAVYIGPPDARTVPTTWRYAPIAIAEDIYVSANERSTYGQTQFGWYGTGYYFPLWYPALVSALSGVGVIRFRRQFSIRSALIAFAVVAALLAMPLAL